MSDTPAEIAEKLYEFLVAQRYQGEPILHAVICCDFVSGRRFVESLTRILAPELERKDERIRELEQEQQSHFQIEDMVLRAKAEQIARLEQANKDLIEALQRLLPLAMDAVPRRGHVGACGPEAGCDGICVDAANCAEVLLFARAVLSKHGGTK